MNESTAPRQIAAIDTASTHTAETRYLNKEEQAVMQRALRKSSPPVETEQSSLLAVISKAARDPSVNVDKMERLMTMMLSMESKQAERDYDAAMSKAQSEMRGVLNDKDNRQTNSRYATYYALDKAIRGSYTNHGFALSFNTDQASKPDYVLVTCRVSHPGGYARNYSIEMPADGKGAKGGDVMTKTHATGSAVQYGMRYLLKMIFNIATTDRLDDDGNASTGEVLLSEEQIVDIVARMENAKLRYEQVCRHFKVKKLNELNAAHYNEVVRVIDETAAYRAKMAKERSK